jgi:hypothetical protein
MKEVNLNFKFKGLDGKELEQNAGTLLANLLSNSNTKTPVKFWEWAVKLHKAEAFEITTDDLKLLRDFIEGSEALTALAKAQILEKL